MLAAGTRLGGYEIQGPLGAGGMGEVYRARDVRLRRDVAVKVLPASFALDRDRIVRFEREAHLLAALNHPNIATLYGIEEAAGATALVMELVEGQTLDARRATSIAETLAIARQIAAALDAAHEKGIVHRDLKPANIRITPDGVVKVLDFGLAKGAGDASAGDLSTSPTITGHGTQAGVILGTAAYMSPEQARGLPVDKRCDIWAFGCVLYEMLAGRRAFAGNTVSDVIAAILRSEPVWDALPPRTPPVVRRLLSRLLEKDPRNRLRDIGDARVELDEALAGRGTIEPAAAQLPHRAWRPATVASMIVFAIAGLLAIVASLVPRHPASFFIGEMIVSQLTNYGGTEASGALAPDGRSFAFVSSQGGTPDIWVRQVAGGEPVRVTDDAAVESDLIYAPDGDTIYYTRADGPDRSIWRIGALGGQARKVLNNALAPSPSPDGRRLAWFEPEPTPILSFSLFVGTTDGSGRKALAEKLLAILVMTRAAWSPDNRSLAYSAGALFAPRNLFVVDAEGGRARQVTHLTDTTAVIAAQAWLPDARRVVVSYTPAGQLFVSDLAVVDIQTGTLIRLTANVSDSFNTPSVSADGRRILATATRTAREMWKVPFGPDPEANGRAAVRLVDASQDPMWAYVTRDGRTLLFNNALAGSRNLWTMPLDGSARPRQITSVPGNAVMHSSLSPDGTHVAFVSSATGNPDVWVQNVDGSDLRQLTNDPATQSWPVWSPDGQRIAFGSLRDGRWETQLAPATGGMPETIDQGFFRGDWIRKPDGSGDWIVSSNGGGGVRLLDLDRRTVVWQERRPGQGMPMFSPDGRAIAVAYQDGRDRDAIWVYDVATGKSRLAVRFPQPFQILFRSSWVDTGRAFVVNRAQTISHIVMLDRFGASSTSTER